VDNQPVRQLPIGLSEASGVPFYRQIVDQLGGMVRSGQLQAGDRLPSVRDLATQLAVSLITTRRAYADLEADGLLVCSQGQGTFVAASGASPRAGAQARTQARQALAGAVIGALQAGLDRSAVLSAVQAALDAEEAGHGR
jgi:GntR family transcriptional regulator